MALLKSVTPSILSIIICATYCAANAVEYVSYNSSDLSYLSNGIQFPAPDSDGVITLRPTGVENQIPEMDWFAKLYNHHHWAGQISTLTNTECRKHMNEYVVALKNGTSWASKSN